MSTPDLVAQTLFCERARAEIQGQVSLSGIFPDNVNFERPLSSPPAAEERVPQIPTLCLYTRIRMPVDRAVRGDIVIRFLAPSGQIIFEGLLDQAFIEQSKEQARQQENEYVLLLQQAELNGFPVLENGRYKAIVLYGGEEHFSGAIRLTVLSPSGSKNPAEGS